MNLGRLLLKLSQGMLCSGPADGIGHRLHIKKTRMKLPPKTDGRLV
jgi:hypothetical protein